MFEFMGLDIQTGIIPEAVETSSFEDLRKYEEFMREYDVRHGKSCEYSNNKFVRNGKIDDHQDLPIEDTSFIRQSCAQMMKLFKS